MEFAIGFVVGFASAFVVVVAVGIKMAGRLLGFGREVMRNVK